MPVHAGPNIGRLLIAEGLCPPEAINVELHIPADGVVTLSYEVYVKSEDFDKLSRVLRQISISKEDT